MNELNEEIKLTINTMQCDIDDGAHGELQNHLYSLLEMKRNELQQRLVERSWSEPVTHDEAPYKSVKPDGQVADEAKPLTTDELKAGGWWCADVSESCRLAFVEKGLDPWSKPWSGETEFSRCYLAGTIALRSTAVMAGLKQIKLIGNEFYWI